MFLNNVKINNFSNFSEFSVNSTVFINLVDGVTVVSKSMSLLFWWCPSIFGGVQAMGVVGAIFSFGFDVA